jgi:hypothetical protein
MNFRPWLKGLAAAAIHAAANTITLIIVDPLNFNATRAGLEHLGIAVSLSAGLAVAFYLKQSPLPDVKESDK